MLAVGRALMLRPRLMLLDEPSFGLAPLIVREIFDILRAHQPRREGVSMLLVEQNAALALELADHAYLLETGRVVMSGPPQRSRRTTRRAPSPISATEASDGTASAAGRSPASPPAASTPAWRWRW